MRNVVNGWTDLAKDGITGRYLPESVFSKALDIKDLPSKVKSLTGSTIGEHAKMATDVFKQVKEMMLNGAKKMQNGSFFLKSLTVMLITLTTVLSSCQKNEYRTVYYRTGEKFERGKEKNGAREGLWISWHESGKKLAERTYLKGRENGPSTEWFENGQIRSLVKYKDGKLVDTAKFFFSNGRLNSLDYYNSSGVHSGEFKVLREDGTLSQKGYFKNSKADSIWETLFENGKVKSTSFFKDGKEIGVWVTYDQEGNIVKKVQY